MILEKIPHEAPPRTHTRSLSLSLSISLRAFAFSTNSHSHDRTQNPSPRPRPRPRNQDRIASTGSLQCVVNTTGQGRQAQGQAIVTTRHRPTPTLPRRNTVSQSPIYRPSLQPVAAVYEARRGEARPESEPEVNLDWELHSPTFLQSRLPLPQYFTLGRSINQSTSQSIPNISPPSRPPASAQLPTHLLLFSLSAPSLCSLPPHPPFSNPP